MDVVLGEREGTRITQEGFMRTYVGQLNLIQRSVFVVDRDSFHRVQSRVRAINDFAKDSVLAV